MAIFGKNKAAHFEPLDTELDSAWFQNWASGLASAVGYEALQERWDAASPVEVLAKLMGKAVAIIDHDGRDYVTRYCSPDALRTYRAYLDSGDVTPWEQISLIAGLNPTKVGWTQFIVDDMKTRLARFGEILIDPTVANL